MQKDKIAAYLLAGCWTLVSLATLHGASPQQKDAQLAALFAADQRFGYLPHIATEDSAIDQPISYTAHSMHINLAEGTLHLQGNAQASSADYALQADNISLDWNSLDVSAQASNTPPKPSGSPEKDTYPKGPILLRQGQQNFDVHALRYNLKTKSGTFHKLHSPNEDAHMHAQRAYKAEDKEVYLEDVRYTTCSLADPHFYIGAKKAKVLGENRVLTGPLGIYFHHAPSPLFFGTGMLLLPSKDHTGLLAPSFGEDSQHGFYLREGGVYWWFQDYIDARVTLDVYTKGYTDLQALLRYAQRYSYTGNLQVKHSYSPADIAAQTPANFSQLLQWSHKASAQGPASLWADVHLHRQYAENPTDKLPSTGWDRSRIHYNYKLPRLAYALTLGIEHSRDRASHIHRLSPSLELKTPVCYPLQGITWAPRWIKHLGISHQLTWEHNSSNSPREVHATELISSGIYSPQDHVPQSHTPQDHTAPIPIHWKHRLKLLRNAQYGIHHTIPMHLRMPSIRGIKTKATLGYEEMWMPYRSGPQIPLHLKRAYFVYADLQLNSRWVGMFPLGTQANPNMLRHTCRPSLSLRLTPDLQDPHYGFYMPSPLGEKHPKACFQDPIFALPKPRRYTSLQFQVDNDLKLRLRSDTGSKKVSLLDKLQLKGAYDFGALQFGWKDFLLQGTHSMLEDTISTSFRVGLDPYYYDLGLQETQAPKRQNKLAWYHGQGLGHFSHTHASIALKLGRKARAHKPLHSQGRAEKQGWLDNMLQYDKKAPGNLEDSDSTTSIPWNLTLQYAYIQTLDKAAYKNKTQHNVHIHTDVAVTPSWDMALELGYDIHKQKLLQDEAKIFLARDLHCWHMEVSWKPIADIPSYTFSIRVKSAKLRPVKYETGERTMEKG